MTLKRVLVVDDDPDILTLERKILEREGYEIETADDGSEAQGIRDAAVFALSQRPEGESLPALMSLAKEAEHADTRRSALFWLAQSDDPAVPEFFAEILAGP